MFDDSTTIVQFPVFSNSLKFPYHECTCEFKSEFEASQNLKYQTEYYGKASYVGVVMYERYPTQGPNVARRGIQMGCSPNRATLP